MISPTTVPVLMTLSTMFFWPMISTQFPLAM